jgi:hypothetical protein
MLVLSRGRNDKVVFPTLGISVEILRVAGNKVRLGIDAHMRYPFTDTKSQREFWPTVKVKPCTFPHQPRVRLQN